jgi:protein-disulfide isomerase
MSKKNSLTPVIIIVLVLAVAVGGGVLLFRNSTAPRPNANRAANRQGTPDNSAQIYANAPIGAQPPQMLGSPTAVVTVEEFADFQCGTCASKYPMTKDLIRDYGSRIKFIFRNYPLQIAAHDKAFEAATAAEAAGMQGKFWDMQNQLFTNQASWSGASDFKSILEEYATKIGLDVEKFKNDMAGMAAKERVGKDMERGRSLGVNSTPTFFINGKQVDFAQVNPEGMKALIDAELAKAANQNTGNK